MFGFKITVKLKDSTQLSKILTLSMFVHCLLGCANRKKEPSLDQSFYVTNQRLNSVGGNKNSDKPVKSVHSPSQYAEILGLEKIDERHDGVYGKKNNTWYFVCDKKLVNNHDRMYWNIVRVLSEKFGCLLTQKQDEGSRVKFNCRDGRKILVRRQLDERHAFFIAKKL